MMIPLNIDWGAILSSADASLRGEYCEPLLRRILLLYQSSVLRGYCLAAHVHPDRLRVGSTEDWNAGLG